MEEKIKINLKELKPFGIRNGLFFCYAISAIQMFFAIPGFVEAILNEKNTSENNMLSVFQQIFYKMIKDVKHEGDFDDEYHENFVEINKLLEKLAELNLGFGGIYFQQDAVELWRHIIADLEDNIKEMNISSESKTLEILENFKFEYTSILDSNETNMKDATLIFPIQKNEKLKMEQLVVDFFEEKTLDDGRKQQFKITKMPKFLTIQLGRFRFSGKSQYKLLNKVDDLDEFTINGEKYVLFSSINHIGFSPDAGHYVMYKNNKILEDEKQEEKYLEYNDKKVRKNLIKIDDTGDKNTPYLLTYVKSTEIDKLFFDEIEINKNNFEEIEKSTNTTNLKEAKDEIFSNLYSFKKRKEFLTEILEKYLKTSTEEIEKEAAEAIKEIEDFISIKKIILEQRFSLIDELLSSNKTKLNEFLIEDEQKKMIQERKTTEELLKELNDLITKIKDQLENSSVKNSPNVNTTSSFDTNKSDEENNGDDKEDSENSKEEESKDSKEEDAKDNKDTAEPKDQKEQVRDCLLEKIEKVKNLKTKISAEDFLSDTLPLDDNNKKQLFQTNFMIRVQKNNIETVKQILDLEVKSNPKESIKLTDIFLIALKGKDAVKAISFYKDEKEISTKSETDCREETESNTRQIINNDTISNKIKLTRNNKINYIISYLQEKDDKTNKNKPQKIVHEIWMDKGKFGIVKFDKKALYINGNGKICGLHDLDENEAPKKDNLMFLQPNVFKIFKKNISEKMILKVNGKEIDLGNRNYRRTL